MAASDHINNMIRVYHSSFSATPPHRRDTKMGLQHFGNVHPDIIHAGTMQAAKDIGEDRPFIHMYDIPAHEAYPVTFGDEGTEREKENPTFVANMRGVQPGLFETISGEPSVALKSNRAVPYRNRAEDKGSISYMIPKKSIGKTVFYAGVDTTD